MEVVWQTWQKRLRVPWALLLDVDGEARSPPSILESNPISARKKTDKGLNRCPTPPWSEFGHCYDVG